MSFMETSLDEHGLSAIVTGGSSGIAKEFCKTLHKAGAKILIVDLNEQAGQAFADELNGIDEDKRVYFTKANVASWDDQVAAFELALKIFGRIDYVYAIAGIGERRVLPKDTGQGFAKPDLSVIDIDLVGVLHTSSLAIQAMRRQEPNRYGFRGKIVSLASTCGFYTIPTLPMYTAAKHGVVGYVRSFGQYVTKDRITINTVCPNALRTNISNEAFYSKMEALNLLVPMESVQKALASYLGANGESGQVLEVGPKGNIVPFEGKAPLDQETVQVNAIVRDRAEGLNAV